MNPVLQRLLLASALLWGLPLAAQVPAPPACPGAEDIEPLHLYGLWQLRLWPEGGNEEQPVSSGVLLFEKHPDYPGSVRGELRRSAAGAGVTAVVIPKDKSVGVNATVRKTSAGAADRIPVVQVTNLSRCLRDLQQLGVWIYGLAGEAEASLYSLDLRGNVALVLGGEADGLRRLTREHCDGLVKIPMPGEIESLNVSVAAGVTLFEAVRQRQ